MSKTILITGCSSGIGYDAAHGLTAAGWTVLATCRKEEDCERLRGEGLASFVLDVADPASIEAGFAEALRLGGGRLDALYNNAAFAIPGAVEDLPVGALREIFETNLFGLHDLTLRAIKVMRAQGAGRIVQCSSVLGLVGVRWRGAYVATKFALEGLTDVLRLEMRDTDVKIVTLNPGPIPTRFRLNAIPHFEKWIDWQGSPRRAQYEGSLLKRLYQPSGKKDAFELPASAVTKVLLRALSDPNPKSHYYITGATHIAAMARRLCPARLRDWIFARA